ncbi:MAG: hypothetical protein KatS3mg029_0798 [Saprospiraceae bacterium]|nr:MAG: hypothetical protein KatS3mg029_0798 [Saprospiraceae bacterium]
MKHLYLPTLFVAALAWGCQPDGGSTNSSQRATTTLDVGFAALFDTVNVVKMHVFVNDDSPNYPYHGKAIESQWHNLLGDDLAPAAGPLFACYWLENDESFIVRLAGGNGDAGTLVLTRFNASTGKLEKVIDLAGQACGEQGCQQLDSWFIDLDDDRDLELVQLTQTFGPDGSKTGEQFTVLARNADGSFTPADEQLASLALRDRYVPVRLVASR